MDDGSTLLHMASQKLNLYMLRCLVKECGADVNQARNDGATALIMAAQNGNLNVLKCLVNEPGADVNKQGSKGWMYTVTYGSKKCALGRREMASE
jgi:ankyrin repeat protein